MKPASKSPTARDWDHWFYLHRDDVPRPRKSDVALVLEVHPAFFSKLLDPQRYQPLVNDDLVNRIAELWNQEPTYVRKLYPRAA
jgi:hypothetical protein